MMSGNKKKYSEYVIICQEPGRDGVTVIDSGITKNLINNLIRMHSRDPEKRYFLSLKKNYQIYGAVWRKQIAITGRINSRYIFELGIQGGK